MFNWLKKYNNVTPASRNDMVLEDEERRSRARRRYVRHEEALAYNMDTSNLITSSIPIYLIR